MIKTSLKIHFFYPIVDFIFIIICFLLSYILKYKINIFTGNDLQYFKEYAFILILWTLFILTVFKSTNLYSTDRSLTIPKETFRVIMSLSYTGILMSAIIFFAQYKFFSRQIFLASFILFCVSLSGWRTIKRLVLRKLIREGFHNINVLIVGAGNMGRIIFSEAEKNPWLGFRVTGLLDDLEEKRATNGVPILGGIKDFVVIAKKHFVDEVIITIPSAKAVVSNLIKQAKEMRLGVRVVPENFEAPLPILNISYLGIIPLLTYKERKHHPTELALKRALDITFSLVLLAILFPLFIIIAILIKLDSKGSIFYVQKRVGFKGKTFNLYKFRSMVKDAEKLRFKLLDKNEVKDGVIFKIKQDPRITRIGKFLRRSSLDELPQLFNVLRGDMGLIGPRPPMLNEVENYNHVHMERLSIRPGITGLSQVRGRSELSFRKWVKWDLWYINNWSLGLDFRILLWTIPVVLKGKGAY